MVNRTNNGISNEKLYHPQMHQLETSIETLWVANSIVLVFLMQMGFALLESGSVRIINRKSSLLKNFVDVSVCIIAWVVCGSYIVRGDIWTGKSEENPVVSGKRLFDLMFACSTATIISGSVTERISIFGYVVITVVVSGFVYPVVVLWAWTDTGFLKQLGYVDFAGSSVVHAVGGAVGIVAAWRLGPRRFGVPEAWALPTTDTPQIFLDEENPSTAPMNSSSSSSLPRRKKTRSERGERSTRTEKDHRAKRLMHVLEERVKFIEMSHYGTITACPITRFSRFERPDLDAKEFKGNSPAFAVIGTLMLWCGFYGFNAGSASISGHSASTVIRVLWNTTLGAAGGQCAALLLSIRARLSPRLKLWLVMDPDIVMSMCNATLAGLASTCAGSNRESGINAFIIGLMGAMSHSCISLALTWCGIDDPLDAGAVHLGGGVAGSLLCGLFPQPDLGKLKAFVGQRPVFPIQLLGVVTIVCWSALVGLIVAEILRRVNLLRVSTALEDVGFDVWLQQSILPPPAPDVLMQLPELKKGGDSRKGPGPAGAAKADALVAMHHLPDKPLGFDTDRQLHVDLEDLRHLPPGRQDSTALSRMTGERMGPTDHYSGAINQFSTEEINHRIDKSSDYESSIDGHLDFEQEYENSLEQQYERELMAMFTVSPPYEVDKSSDYESRVDSNLDFEQYYENSIEQRYERELMAMCSGSQDSDADVESQDADKSVLSGWSESHAVVTSL